MTPTGPDNDPEFTPLFRVVLGQGFNGQPEEFMRDSWGNVTIKNPGFIWHLTVLRHAIRLEAQGLKHSKGTSALKVARERYGFKGNRKKVLAQIDEYLAPFTERF